MATAGSAADSLNGDLGVRVRMDTSRMEWQSSPGGRVWRKRVHRVGPPESGQVTSVVRYDPGSRFPAHDHPEGEEILVLEGVFSDEHGDWPAGTLLLNPEGFRHEPFSEPGCLIFVKLRQYAGDGRVHLAVQTRDLGWQAAGRSGVEEKRLYQGPDQGPDQAPDQGPDQAPGQREEIRLERWQPGAALGRIDYPGGVEILVLEGAFEDVDGVHPEGTWLRLPPGASHEPSSASGCELYVKAGGVASLRSG